MNPVVRSRGCAHLLALSSACLIATLAMSARAEDWHRDDHRGRHWDNRYHGDYGAPPPVVYGGPAYAPPPVVYSPPGIGFSVPGVSVVIH